MSDLGKAFLLLATGPVVAAAARELASTVARLDPDEYPSLTVDLREATQLDPIVMHALLTAWGRRGRQDGAVRLLVAAGPVERFLGSLRLERVFAMLRQE